MCLVKTVRKPLAESSISFYTTDWQPVESRFGLPDIGDAGVMMQMLVERPDSIDAIRFNRLCSYIEPVMVSADCSNDDNIITYSLSLPFVTKDKADEIKAVIKKKSFKWDGDGRLRSVDKNITQVLLLVKTEFISVDRIKDEIAVLVKEHSEDKRTIVSFLLSTLLNNICKKKDGYKLFGKQDLSMAVLLIDIALHIYAFFPSFDQTRKIISIIAYIDSEIDFRNDKVAKIKLSRTINKYSFIFCSGNVFDLCDWFPFFYEYNIALDTKTEEILIRAAEEYNDPIIWANLLLYSRYYKPFNEELVKKVEGVVEQQISKLSNKAQLMQVEFWYVLIFHNCPFINSQLQVKISDIIKNIKKNCGTQKQSTNHSGSLLPSEEVTKLICDFLEQHSPKGKKPEESLFNWKGNNNFANQITYRTYQRTVFKRYRKNTYGLNASLD